MHSLFRRKTYAALKKINLSGSIIDLGGTHNADYHKIIGGSFTISTINIEPTANPTIVADLEQPLKINDAAYDGAILMNVLEHIYHHQQLVNETWRILKPDGIALGVAPFLFPIHPSPNDFFRFTDHALEKIFSDAGFIDIKVTPIGAGVMKTRHLMIGRLLPRFASAILEIPLSWYAELTDILLSKIARIADKNYSSDFYPLGYLIEAKKPKI